MFRIVYISGETSRFTKDGLEALLEQSRMRNARLGITGLLLYRNGNFLQVIEGDEPAVSALFEAIRRDPRHRRVIPVLQEEIPARDFPEWAMAFREIGLLDGSIPPGFSDFLHLPWDEIDVTAYSDTIRRLLKMFVSATS